MRHSDTDFIPGTQHLAIAAWLGWSLATFAAVIWGGMTIRGLRIDGYLKAAGVEAELVRLADKLHGILDQLRARWTA